jgi:glutathione S-transferase
MRTDTSGCDSTETEKIAGIKQDTVDCEIERSRSLLSILESTLCGQGSGPWLFGFDGPTALDAHVVVFINRLRDVGRAKLISSTLAKYADAAMETSEWRKLMDKREVN